MNINILPNDNQSEIRGCANGLEANTKEWWEGTRGAMKTATKGIMVVESDAIFFI